MPAPRPQTKLSATNTGNGGSSRQRHQDQRAERNGHADHQRPRSVSRRASPTQRHAGDDGGRPEGEIDVGKLERAAGIVVAHDQRQHRHERPDIEDADAEIDQQHRPDLVGLRGHRDAVADAAPEARMFDRRMRRRLGQPAHGEHAHQHQAGMQEQQRHGAEAVGGRGAGDAQDLPDELQARWRAPPRAAARRPWRPPATGHRGSEWRRRRWRRPRCRRRSAGDS